MRELLEPFPRFAIARDKRRRKIQALIDVSVLAAQTGKVILGGYTVAVAGPEVSIEEVVGEVAPCLTVRRVGDKLADAEDV